MSSIFFWGNSLHSPPGPSSWAFSTFGGETHCHCHCHGQEAGGQKAGHYEALENVSQKSLLTSQKPLPSSQKPLPSSQKLEKPLVTLEKPLVTPEKPWSLWFKFQGFPPKMVFGHNLHLMAPFELIPAGFCIIFRRASFMFLVPRAKSGPKPKFGPGPKGAPLF